MITDACRAVDSLSRGVLGGVTVGTLLSAHADADILN